MSFASIAPHDLGSVTGGTSFSSNPTSCTTANPAGAQQFTQSMETSHAGPSVDQRVTAAYDKAMAPWATFNGIFAGAAGGGSPPGSGAFTPVQR